MSVPIRWIQGAPEIQSKFHGISRKQKSRRTADNEKLTTLELRIDERFDTGNFQIQYLNREQECISFLRGQRESIIYIPFS